MEKKSARIIGCLIIVTLSLFTAVLQIERIIDLFANFTDLYLFAILLPSLSFAITLALRGEVRNPLAWSEYTKSKTVPPELVPTAQPSSLSSSVKLFEPSILPDKIIFHRGEYLLIRMRFEGTLKQGYRAALATFSDKTVEPIYDLTTLPDIYAKGNLDGHVSFDEQWPWRVPPNAPIGRCELFIAPCTLTKDVPLNLKVRRYPLRLRNPHRIDLAKPGRQAVIGRTLAIELAE